MYYFIGIKGSGMSSLACILKDCGEDVAGSDIEKFIFTQTKLEEYHIPFFAFNKDNIKDGMHVIIGNAFDETNEEVKAAKDNPTVTTYTYPEFLGHLTKEYHSICVSGTHGKTTTTGMLSHVFEQVMPTGYLIGDGSGFMPQHAKAFVLEACEYKSSFLSYTPDYAIILNLELDHVDYYPTMKDYLHGFSEFAKNVRKGIAIFGDQEECRKLEINVHHLYYGLHKDNDVYADNVVEDEDGVHFDCIYNNELAHHFDLPYYGIHLLWNALGVITIGIMNDIPMDKLEEGLQTFRGVSRRFNVEEVNDYVYIDDYAHHPTAIDLTIKAAKQKYPDKKVIAIFEPDRFSRIAYFLDEFDKAFKEADAVYLLPFPKNAVHEKGINIDIYDLQKAVSRSVVIEENEEAIHTLDKHKDAVYLFMSSKDIYKLKDKLKSFQND